MYHPLSLTHEHVHSNGTCLRRTSDIINLYLTAQKVSKYYDEVRRVILIPRAGSYSIHDGRDITWMPRVAVSDGQRLETTSNRHIVTARAPLAITSVVLSAPSPPPLQPLNPEQIYHTYRKDAYHRSLVRSLLELVEQDACPKGCYQLAFLDCCITCRPPCQRSMLVGCLSEC
jgi:hypothetical protein